MSLLEKAKMQHKIAVHGYNAIYKWMRSLKYSDWDGIYLYIHDELWLPRRGDEDVLTVREIVDIVFLECWRLI